MIDDIDELTKEVMYNDLRPASALCDPDNPRGVSPSTSYCLDSNGNVQSDATLRQNAQNALAQRQAYSQQVYNTWLNRGGQNLWNGADPTTMVPWEKPVVNPSLNVSSKKYDLNYGRR